MTEFKVTDEVVEAAAQAISRRHLSNTGVPFPISACRDDARTALEAALPVMFEQFGWVGTDAESGYTRIFETERELSRHAGNDWFSAAPLYRLKEPK